MEYKNLTYHNVLPSYLDNPLLKPGHLYETGLDQSLEKIVMDDEPEKEKDLVDKVFSDKSRILKTTVKVFFNEITTRKRLDSDLLKKIDSEICHTDSYLAQIRELTKRQYTPDLELAFSRRRTQLEDRVLNLEKEKRQEYLTCFKDLSISSRYLLSALKEYWSLSGKKSFLGVENDNGYRGPVQEIEAYNWN